MLTINTADNLLEFFLHNSIKDALHDSLKFLESKMNIGGIVIIIHDTLKDHYSLIASSQLKNISGIPIAPPIEFSAENELTFVSSQKLIEQLALVLEIDYFDDKISSAYYNRPIPSSIYNIILVEFGSSPNIAKSNMVLISKLYTMVIRDSFFLRQIKEQTNKVNLSEYEENHKSRELDTYRELLESTDEGIIVFDSKYTIKYMNHAGESITGYSSEGLINKSIKDIASPENYALFDFDPKLLPSNFVLNIITTSNDKLNLGVNKSSLLTDSGLTMLIFRDITATIIMEQRLQSTSDFLTNLIDNSIVAIVACELNENIILFNPSAGELFGYSSEDVVLKMGMVKLFPEEEKWINILDMITKNDFGGKNRLDRTKSVVVSASGENIPVIISAYIIPNSDNKNAVVLFITDLRLQLEMEEKLNSYQKKLAEQEKKALITELAGAMAHELNQPLMSIIGYSTLLKKTDISKEKRDRAINYIATESERMADIVKKIGNLTKYETRKYVGNANIIDLDKSSGDIDA